MAWWPIVDKKNKVWPHLAIVLAYASSTNNLTAQYWVDKTPANERHLQRIWEDTNAAKVIHVIRDPLATLASRKKMEPAISLRNALADLKVSFKVAAQQSGLRHSHFMQVHYEELCEDPQLITKEIAAFLGIHRSDTLSQPTVAGAPSQANSSFIKEPAAGNIIRTAQHAQPDMLTKSEKDLIAAYIGSLSGKLNYPMDPVGFLRGLYLRIRYRLLG